MISMKLLEICEIISERRSVLWWVVGGRKVNWLVVVVRLGCSCWYWWGGAWSWRIGCYLRSSTY